MLSDHTYALTGAPEDFHIEPSRFPHPDGPVLQFP